MNEKGALKRICPVTGFDVASASRIQVFLFNLNSYRECLDHSVLQMQLDILVESFAEKSLDELIHRLLPARRVETRTHLYEGIV